MDMTASSQVVEIAERFFFGLNAKVEMMPVMALEDLDQSARAAAWPVFTRNAEQFLLDKPWGVSPHFRKNRALAGPSPSCAYDDVPIFLLHLPRSSGVMIPKTFLKLPPSRILVGTFS